MNIIYIKLSYKIVKILIWAVGLNVTDIDWKSIECSDFPIPFNQAFEEASTCT